MQTFIETGLNPEILESIEKLGFTQPTPIQSKAIPFLLENDQDLIAMAQTGTGKTAAFGLPILHKMDKEMRGIQSIILCPTRELCLQITKDLRTYATAMNVSVVPVYGGAPVYEQVSAIRKKCDIVVGTPGRVNDLINRSKLDLSNIRYLVLDEADEMLKMGFKDEMDAILDQTPDSKQTLLFSATIPADINQMAGKHMHQPHTISVSRQNTSNTDISHEYCVTSPANSYQALRRIADINSDIYGIVFCRTRHETKEIAAQLMGDGYNADALHGDLSQSQRDYVMDRFRNKNLQILVATDVAARGLDVNNLTHVIHYHLPDDPENYIHRSGRTGRAGRKGISIAILAPSETRRLSFVEKQAGHKFIPRPIPSGKEVLEKRLSGFITEIAQTETTGFDSSQHAEAINSALDGLSREELIEKFVAYHFSRLQGDYKNAPDLNVTPGKGSKSGTSRRIGRVNKDKFARYSINVGSKNNLRPDVLISIINRQTPERKIAIGKIDIQKKVSFFEAESQHEKHLIKAFRKARFKGMSLMLQPMEAVQSRNSSERRVRRSKN